MVSDILRVDGVCKSYKKNVILENVSFAVQENEVFGIVGLNGAGKTTLIKIILGLISGDEGSFSLNDQKKVFYLPEKFCPSPLLTGKEFIKFSNSFFKVNERNEKISEYFEIFSIDIKFLSKRIGSYSKGMGQKVGLIAAFMSDADILILDEPMSGLDPLARITLKNEILKHKNKGKTTIFSSHILSDVEEICHRFMLVYNKKVNFLGKVDAFLTETGKNNLEDAFLQKINN